MLLATGLHISWGNVCYQYWMNLPDSSLPAMHSLRGDRAAYKELYLRSQEELAADEKLNNKVAEEIGRLRNSNNNIWKIDMDGLRASRGMQAIHGEVRCGPCIE